MKIIKDYHDKIEYDGISYYRYDIHTDHDNFVLWHSVNNNTFQKEHSSDELELIYQRIKKLEKLCES